jgi:hypothetical protein
MDERTILITTAARNVATNQNVSRRTLAFGVARLSCGRH